MKKGTAVLRLNLVRNVKPTRIRCHGICSFCHTKQMNVRPELHGTFGFGDLWTCPGAAASTTLTDHRPIAALGPAKPPRPSPLTPDPFRLGPPKKNYIFRPNPPAGDEYPMDSGPAAPPPLVRRRWSLTIEYRLLRGRSATPAFVLRH